MLLAAEIAAVGLLSALFLNDTVCLMFTPFVLELVRSLGRRPMPYLLALATAANVGSTTTLTGNPQNMIVGVASGLSYLDFAAALLPVALLGLVVVWAVLVRLYPDEFRPGRLAAVERAPAPYNGPLLTKRLIGVAGLLAAFLAGVPVAEAPSWPPARCSSAGGYAHRPCSPSSTGACWSFSRSCSW
jgi:Na+/H+ antiporter NhaD/arsenite permease-like protein